MSRVGRMPVAIPQGVDVRVEERTLRVKGPRGQLARPLHPVIGVTVERGQILVTRGDDERQSRALHGLYRSLIANMVRGVTQGYRVDLEVHGVGYRAAKQGHNLTLQVGFSHPVTVTPPDGITLDAPQPNRIAVAGIDKELVGQVAARIRAVRPPDAYKGKGIRYAGERVKLKPGKAGRTAGKG